MSDAASNTHGNGLLQMMQNLYLILLRFRFPPINVVQEAPNLFTYLPLHSDSILLSADIVKGSHNDDTRFDYVKTAIFHKFDKENPRSLNLSEKYSTPLSSVLLPIIRRQNNVLELFISTRIPYVLIISLSSDERSAKLKELKRIDSLSRYEKLWIRKRDNIGQLALVNKEHINLKNLIGSIGNKSGGYRAIDATIKIPIEYLSTELVFFASVSNINVLEEELEMLTINGVGKKRDMGFGDLIEWQVYQVIYDGKVTLMEPMVILTRENKDTQRIITIRNTPALLITSLRKIGDLLPLSIRMVLSRIKPPYWFREELCIMPFSEFLIKTKRDY